MLPFQSNVWTSGNEYNVLGNWTFYNFPEQSRGLGGILRRITPSSMTIFRAGSGEEISSPWNRNIVLPSRTAGYSGGAFANVQSVSDWPGNAFTVLHPGVGFGVRVKMNKCSDTNVAIDFALGLNGSNGIFVNLGEVF